LPSDPVMERLQSALGIVVFCFIAWLFCEERTRIPWRAVLMGVALQCVIAAILLRMPFGQELFLLLNRGVLAIQQATEAGAGFVFGYLAGGPQPFALSRPGADFIFALRALPLVLVMSALSSLLFFWRILPRLVNGFSFLLERTFGIGGALGLGAAANVFVGMIEAPLLIRPYLRAMGRHELFAVMVCGMATIAGTVLVLYATILEPVLPGAIGHLLTASIISAPAALAVSMLMVPGDARTQGALEPRSQSMSAIDAVVKGTVDGVGLLIHIIAMLIVFVALVHLTNQFLGFLPHIGGSAITLQRVLGLVMAPVAWCMGIPWAESLTAGSLLGVKTIMNETLAYLDLARLPASEMGPRSRLIMTYALCGFANFGSLGIMIGGMGSMAPERKEEIVSLGLKSIIAGTLATCMTGSVVGLFTG